MTFVVHCIADMLSFVFPR